MICVVCVVCVFRHGGRGRRGGGRRLGGRVVAVQAGGAAAPAPRAVVGDGRGRGARGGHNRGRNRPLALDDPEDQHEAQRGDGGGGGQQAAAIAGSQGSSRSRYRAPPRHVVVPQDLTLWLNGNPNRFSGSKGEEGEASHNDNLSSAISEHVLPPPTRRSRRRVALPFSEPMLFQNQYKYQLPEVNALNDFLVSLFENIASLRKLVYDMKVQIKDVNDRVSFGKVISVETDRMKLLVKAAEAKVEEVRKASGVPTPIPAHFHTRVRLIYE